MPGNKGSFRPRPFCFLCRLQLHKRYPVSPQLTISPLAAERWGEGENDVRFGPGVSRPVPRARKGILAD